MPWINLIESSFTSMLDQEEKIINAQNRIVNIQYRVLMVLGFMFFDLITKMKKIAVLFYVQLRQLIRLP
jgi:hypothetical protein